MAEIGISRKIMGMTLNIAVDDTELLKVDSVVNYANDIYTAVQAEYSNKTQDSSRLRALAIYTIVSELQTIKGEKDVFLDTNTKKVNDLIKKIDSLNLQN
ncbi:MAG: hypothetical protein II816_06825 [Elusimicrobia bacterium]|nr:hypothetical protein [Elusimicrobiota bacterium]